jgi:hypothetical protein
MNLWGERKIASFEQSSPGLPVGFISICTYGPAAAKSQNESAPWRWRSALTAWIFEPIPVTFDAAEKLPIRSGRSW